MFIRFHKTEMVLNMLAEKGVSVEFLPPYSPFLNPIENMFSKWKGIVKKTCPQNEADLFNSIQNSIQTISEVDCEGYCRHMLAYIPRCISNECIVD